MVLPPPALRRYVNFARLTARSLEAIARVVDRDDEFRTRVAAVVDEDQVGRAGWLWLARPGGWAAELADIQGESATRAAAAAEEREERAATRKLAAAQAAAGRAEAEAAERLLALEAARGELVDERSARAAAEARVAELEGLVAELSSSRADVVRNLKDVESRLVVRATEVNAVKARLRALEDEVRRDRPSPATPPPSDRASREGDAVPAGPVPTGPVPPGPAPPGPDSAPVAGQPVAVPPVGATTPSVPPPVTPERPGGVDPAAVAAEVARAARGAAGLASALAALAQLVGDGAVDVGVDGTRLRPKDVDGAGVDRAGVDAAGAAGPGVGGVGVDGVTAAAEPLTGAPGRSGAAAADTAVDGARPLARRMPVPLPGGMFDDTVEAAEHLLRTPGAVLVVDGYNVTMHAWPELSVAEQRRRLVVALTDLTARTATRAEVVFDGAEVEAAPVPAPLRPLLRVRFSAPGVEADDVVIDLVGRLPAATPVLVASSDNRVREGARRRGANLLHARQLVALLRR